MGHALADPDREALKTLILLWRQPTISVSDVEAFIVAAGGASESGSDTLNSEDRVTHAPASFLVVENLYVIDNLVDRGALRNALQRISGEVIT
jgi:hypothetical protein